MAPLFPSLLMSHRLMKRTYIKKAPLYSNPTSLGPEVRYHFPLFLIVHRLLPVAAEYLAKGYTLSDQILQRAIEIDSKSASFHLAYARC